MPFTTGVTAHKTVANRLIDGFFLALYTIPHNHNNNIFFCFASKTGVFCGG